ncbi:MAG: DUF6526 family protein [Vicinamibacterales bacterium]
MAEPVQTYKNHSKFVPAYHFVAFPLIVINMGWALYRMFSLRTGDSIVNALTAIALVIVFFMARIFALRVQDRVIRLEMRLRLREVLPLGLHPRIVDFTPDQLVAMRFASDEELPELATVVLRDHIHDKKVIKQMIREWQADHLRA